MLVKAIKKWLEGSLWHGSQCPPFSLSSQGCLWPPRCPSKCSLQNVHSHTPLPHTHSPHTHTHRRMCHEGPPAVAVTDTGNAQDTSIFKIRRAYSLSYTYTPKINMAGLSTLLVRFQGAFPSVIEVTTIESHQIHPTSHQQLFINRTGASQQVIISFQ